MELYAIDDILFLNDLSEDLAGCLLNIAYSGDSANEGYIKDMQVYYKEEYGAGVKSLRRFKDMDFIGERNLFTAVGCIVNAYDGLQEILQILGNSEPSPEERAGYIEEEAKNILFENLIFPDELEFYEEQHAV